MKQERLKFNYSRTAAERNTKHQTPSSKEAPSSKLKNRPARRLPGICFLGFGV